MDRFRATCVLGAAVGFVSGVTPTAAIFAQPQETITETFEGGTNLGGWSFGRGGLEPAGGNPGWHLRTTDLDTFAPRLRTTEPSPFTGDYRETGVVAIGVDLVLDHVDFSAAERPLSLILIHDNGTPNDFTDDWGAFTLGPNIPLPGEGWLSYEFDVPSESDTLPAGWEFIEFGPGATPDWNTLITNVAAVEFFYGDPRMFFIFQMWNTGADNILIRRDVSACAIADVNDDGEVNASDITAFLNAWFTDRANGTAGDGDINGDGTVDASDITEYLAAWFAARADGCV